MNAEKMKKPIAKKLTAAVMSAAMIFSAAGSAGFTALRGDNAVQSVRADNYGVSLLADSADYYYDTGKFSLHGTTASDFKSAKFSNNVTVVNTMSESTVNVNFTDSDTVASKEDGLYTYVARGTADGNSITWELKAWPEGQTNPHVEAGFDWDDGYKKAAPYWVNINWASTSPWLHMNTKPIASSTSVSTNGQTGVDVIYKDAVYGQTNYVPFTVGNAENDFLKYKAGNITGKTGNVPLYSYPDSPSNFVAAFSQINAADIAAINGGTNASDVTVEYPAYDIPAIVDWFWTNKEVTSIINHYNNQGSVNYNPISALRLDNMSANITVDAAKSSALTTGYIHNGTTFNAEYDATQYATFSNAAVTFKRTYDGFGSLSTGKIDDVTVFASNLKNVMGQECLDVFGGYNREVFVPDSGSLMMANTRMSLNIDVTVDYSVLHGHSRATGVVNGTLDGTPPKPDDPTPDKPNDPVEIVSGAIKSTTATSTKGGVSHVIPCSEDAFIYDRIVYEDLDINTTYTVFTSVIDKSTGRWLITNTQSAFTAVSENGYVDVTIPLNTTGYAGKSLVVTEAIYRGDIEVGTHEDLNDVNQTVTVESAAIGTGPNIYKTVATNGSLTNNYNYNYNYNYGYNGYWTSWGYDKMIPCSTDAVINDRVYYEGLEEGATYTITATLYDAYTGIAILNTNTNNNFMGNANVQFTANSRLGFIDVKIPFDSSKYSGRSIVVFESITTYDKDLRRTVEVCSHKDLTDPDQTVYVTNQVQGIGSITKTVATDASSNSHTLSYSTAARIRDTISYTGLTVGSTYTIRTSVYDKSAGRTIATKDSSITANSANGDIDVYVDLDSTPYAGRSLVVFETISLNNQVVCYHIDQNDTNQTVTVAAKPSTTPSGTDSTPIVDQRPDPTPSKPTEVIGIASNKSVAIDSVNKTHTMSYSVNAEILNRVDYSGLENGALYSVTSTVVDKSTGSVVLNPVTKAFTADTSKSYVDVYIPIDTTQYPGKSFVVYASISRDGQEVSSYKNLNDANATVTVATSSTVLTADNTTSKSVPVSQSVTLIDLVRYEGLTPGETYKITGHVLHKESANGKELASSSAVFDGMEGSLVTNGAKVVATQVIEFTPTSANGTVTVQFAVNTVGLSGQHLVAVEIIADKDSNAIVTEHKDINDANQTVVVKTSSNVYTGGNDMTTFFVVGSIVCIAAAGGVAAFFFIRRKKRSM